MTDEFYVIAIAALLPLTACMLVCQVNPYHALVIRGILGAIAALVYALFGAADVALTEALVGTMLSITLYAVAVRSSLSMKVGVLDSEPPLSAKPSAPIHESDPWTKTENLARTSLPEPLFLSLRKALSRYYMRLELIPYANRQTLQNALQAKEIHATCFVPEPELAGETAQSLGADEPPAYQLQTRVQRLYEIVQPELPPAVAHLTYVNSTDPSPAPLDPKTSQPAEGQL